MNNEKYESSLIFMSAVTLLISGATARGVLDLDDVLECLAKIKADYEDEIIRQSKEN
jgi:hypothetical protein